MTTENENQTTEESASRSNAERFVHAFESNCSPQYIKDTNGDMFIAYKYEGVSSIFKIEKNSSETFIMMLMRKFRMGGGSRAAQKVLEELQSITLEKGIQKKVYIRYGRKNDSLYINLANPAANGVVEINPSFGFKLINESPVPLWTSPNLRPIPLPQPIAREEFLKKWDDLFYFEEEYGSYLLLAFVIKSMIVESGTCPFVIFDGPQGSGKSTMTRILKNLIDPTFPLLFNPPNSEENVAISASLVHLLAYDNMSSLEADMADVMCRLSTGAGLCKRKLFSNGELSAFDFQKSAIFNGIDDPSHRPDFQARAITLHLKPFDSTRTLTADTTFWENFEKDYPRLVGGIYQLTADVLGILPTIKTENLPRLSDFVRIGLALDQVIKKPEEYFLDIFNQHQQIRDSNLFDNNEFCLRLKHILESNQGILEDSPMKILRKLSTSDALGRGHNQPKNIPHFRNLLKRYKSTLTAHSIEWKDMPRKSDQRLMRIWIKDYKVSELEEGENLLI